MLEAFDNKVADPYPLEQYEAIGKRGVRRNDGLRRPPAPPATPSTCSCRACSSPGS